MLTMACTVSPPTTLALFSSGICPILGSFLTFEKEKEGGEREGGGEGGEVVSSFWSHPEQFLEILSLILVLLPPLPVEGEEGKEGKGSLLNDLALLEEVASTLFQPICQVIFCLILGFVLLF